MKRLFLLHICLFLLSGASLLYGQDIIIKKNGEELKVKVVEINPSEIIFKYTDSLQGPLYSIVRLDIFMIKYANGTKEVINEDPVSSKRHVITGQGIIEKKGSAYYENGVRLSEGSAFGLIRDSKNQMAIMEINAARTAKKTGMALIITGIPLSSVGMLFLMVGGLTSLSDNRSSNSYSNAESKSIITIGIAGMAAGILCIVSGSVIKSQGKVHVSNAIRMYNDDIKKLHSSHIR